MNTWDLQAKIDEKPSDLGRRLALHYISTTPATHRASYAQYFTPQPVAKYMASLFSNTLRKQVCILEPAAGVGILSSALCEYMFEANPNLVTITLHLYEVDTTLVPYLVLCIEYLAMWLLQRNIVLIYEIFPEDFVSATLNYITKNQLTEPTNQFDIYDFIIANPPYYKVNAADERTKFSELLMRGHTNIYSMFMASAAQLLVKNGELVFITPRSYTSGVYFTEFRRRFFSTVAPIKFHLFHSRSSVFGSDNILQETIIIKARKGTEPREPSLVDISLSHGSEDIWEASSLMVPTSLVLGHGRKHNVVLTPATEYEKFVIELFNSWSGSLEKYDLKVSTGPVVPFRSEDICELPESEQDYAPLIWMQNISSMNIMWPIENAGSQYILKSHKSQKILVQNRNYVIVRRFSSKEQPKVVVASPYLRHMFPYHEEIGIENHLNFVSRNGADLALEEAYGLAAVLDSKIFNDFIRVFNGSTQINSTTLRHVPLPPIELIKKIGEFIVSHRLSTNNIDPFVTQFLLNLSTNRQPIYAI